MQNYLHTYCPAERIGKMVYAKRKFIFKPYRVFEQVLCRKINYVCHRIVATSFILNSVVTLLHQNFLNRLTKALHRESIAS